MISRQAFTFYPADHQMDLALQSCSLAARGLWEAIRYLMHQGEPYGHLTFPGAPVIPGACHGVKPRATASMADFFGQNAGIMPAKRRQFAGKTPAVRRQKASMPRAVFVPLAMLVNADPKTVQNRFLELGNAGVFSVTAEGLIYSRHMVRSAAASADFRARGQATQFRSGADPRRTGGEKRNGDMSARDSNLAMVPYSLFPIPKAIPKAHSVNAPFALNGELKRLGLRFDPERRAWLTGDPAAAAEARRLVADHGRRQAAASRRAASVGADPGGELAEADQSPAARFVAAWFAAGRDPADLEKGFRELAGDWHKITGPNGGGNHAARKSSGQRTHKTA